CPLLTVTSATEGGHRRTTVPRVGSHRARRGCCARPASTTAGAGTAPARERCGSRACRSATRQLSARSRLSARQTHLAVAGEHTVGLAWTVTAWIPALPGPPHRVGAAPIQDRPHPLSRPQRPHPPHPVFPGHAHRQPGRAPAGLARRRPPGRPAQSPHPRRWHRPGPRCRHRRPHPAPELRSRRRPHQPDQDAQAPDVRPHRPRSPMQTRPARPV
ncbi:LOW QUALITY PROTEIN: transposase IS204 family protein, partial [Streptomyces viridosporus ATCC 14672]